jgi:hypothetical protein
MFSELGRLSQSSSSNNCVRFELAFAKHWNSFNRFFTLVTYAH